MSNADVPVWEKYTLTIEEASKYFRIEENKLRKLAEENPTAGWVILNGNRIQIKRKQFENWKQSILDHNDYIEKYHLTRFDSVRYTLPAKKYMCYTQDT